MIPSALPCRAGVGFKPEHFAAIIAGPQPIGFFEVHAENYMGAGGPPHAQLGRLREDFSLSIHGVGLSIGLDWVVTDGTNTGTATVPPGSWAAVTYSVTRATAGVPGTIVASEASKAEGAAGDVFAYVLPGSTLPPPIVGIPLRGQDSTEISVFLPGQGNLDAHDLYIGLIYRDNPQLAAMLPPPTCFFSVSDATKAAIPAGWLTTPADRSGATIFSTTWIPGPLGSAGAWGPVTVAYRAIDFGIGSGEDIDGIAIDLVRGEVLFSTDLALGPPRNPLLWSRLGTGLHSIYVLPAWVPNPGPVVTAMGISGGPDDLDGVCALDPGTLGNPHPADLDRMIGTWSQPVAPTLPTDLQSIVVRRFDPASTTEFVTSFMTGWPPPAPQVPGFALCAVTIAPPQLGPYVTLGLSFRPDPASQYFVFEGHPERCEWPIPPAFSLSGVPLSVLWLAGSNGGLSLSHPNTISL